MSIVEMKLHPGPFERMKAGEKTEEYRLCDEKRQELEVGDYIRFKKRPELEEVLLTEIVSLERYPNFRILFEHAQDSFPEQTSEELAESMRRYYSKENEEKYGALKIGIRCVSKEE